MNYEKIESEESDTEERESKRAGDDESETYSNDYKDEADNGNRMSNDNQNKGDDRNRVSPADTNDDEKLRESEDEDNQLNNMVHQLN